MKLSERISSMQESPIRKLVPLAEAAKKNGINVIHLNIGQPDIRTPQAFKDAINRFDKEVIAYSFSEGEPDLIGAISSYYKRHGMDYGPGEILITNGGSEALLFSLIAVTDAGDEVLVPEPFYTNYNGFSVPINVHVVPITTDSEQAFSLPDRAEIVSKITPRTKAILFSNPGNPTGAVYSAEEIAMLAEIAKEHGLYVIADEVYREFVYDDFQYVSMGHHREIGDQVIIVDSISKRFSACGARIGSIASKNRELIASILKLCQARLCVATLEQAGAKALYEIEESYFGPIQAEYDKRRTILYEGLNRIPGVMCKKPRGAFYLIADLPVDDAEDFAKWMLSDFQYEGATLMVAPAQGFYATEGLGKNQVRMAYVLETGELEKAVRVLEQALKAYGQQ